MVVEKDPKSKELPIERVQRVGDYFKSLFVRSLRRDLGDGFCERPTREPPAPVETPARPESPEDRAQALRPQDDDEADAKTAPRTVR